jgi:hypothetical protein
MSDLEAFGAAAWLPARVRRAQAAEDAAERREARRSEAARAEASDAAHDRHLGHYKAACELRGEHVSAMALATGEDIGRSLDDILADAIAAADHEDARQAARAHREAGLEPEHVEVGRSDGWPYDLDRQLRQAEDNHRELVALRARLDYPAALEAARARQEAVRSAPQAPVIYQDAFGREITRGTEGAIGDVW